MDVHSVWHVQNQTGTCPKKDRSTLFLCDDHRWWSSQQRLYNVLTTTLPRAVSIAIIERNGKRYLGAAFGVVDWVRNLRAAGEAILTRGRRSETVNARELPPREAALVLREEITGGNPFARYFGVTVDSSLEEFERTTVSHPVFL